MYVVCHAIAHEKGDESAIQRVTLKVRKEAFDEREDECSRQPDFFP